MKKRFSNYNQYANGERDGSRGRPCEGSNALLEGTAARGGSVQALDSPASLSGSFSKPSGLRPLELVGRPLLEDAVTTSKSDRSDYVFRFCPNTRWLRGTCKHNTERYRAVPCKLRSCPYCGAVKRNQYAQRISYGIRELWPAAWLVLTYKTDPGTRSRVRYDLARFVKALRKLRPGLEYVATYELQRRGAIHINLLVSGWKYIPQKTLLSLWGRGWLHVTRVRGSEVMSRENIKSYAPYKLANYLQKTAQAIKVGNAISFSRGWPTIPDFTDGPNHQGIITWRVVGEVDVPFLALSGSDRKEQENWAPVATAAREYAHKHEYCRCFYIADVEHPPGLARASPWDTGPVQIAFPITTSSGGSVC